MGTANVKAIRSRIKSVDSTKHITKAMELVASSKIKKATAKMDHSREYRELMLEAFASLAVEETAYSVKRDGSLPSMYIVIAGDRGLAGGYNNNIFRLSQTLIKDGDLVFPVGKRSVDYYIHHPYSVFSDRYVTVEHFNAALAKEIADLVKEEYDSGRISEVKIISTRFDSMLSQRPVVTPVLPLTDLKESRSDTEDAEKVQYEYEPSAELILSAIISDYISGVIVSLVSEAYASEIAARRSAMDTATRNAEEMLDSLNISYNRARQGAITQEITEIVAGANA
jgi:F-type H+-transporting ATPase subunit gamma